MFAELSPIAVVFDMPGGDVDGDTSDLGGSGSVLSAQVLCQA
jgi:hypothetical protein